MYIHVHVCVGTSWYVDEGEEGRREKESGRGGKEKDVGRGREKESWGERGNEIVGEGGDEKQHYSSSIPGSQGQIMATQQFDDN